MQLVEVEKKIIFYYSVGQMKIDKTRLKYIALSSEWKDIHNKPSPGGTSPCTPVLEQLEYYSLSLLFRRF